MVNKDIREELPEDSLVFDNPSFDNSIIGYDIDGRVVYDYYSMIEELMKEHNVSEEGATAFIEYNTLRSLPYAGDKSPIVVYNIKNMYE